MSNTKAFILAQFFICSCWSLLICVALFFANLTRVENLAYQGKLWLIIMLMLFLFNIGMFELTKPKNHDTKNNTPTGGATA